MSEMLITQALDERDLLKKKIMDAIAGQMFVSSRKKNKDVDFQNAPVDKITGDIQATYQSITDMIKRYNSIIQKIAESNATTTITVDDKTMTVSAAISLLKDIKDGTYFEYKLLNKFEKDFNSINNAVDRNNNTVEANKQTLLNNLISRNDSKKPNQDEIDLVSKTLDGDYAEFIDPLDITNKIKELKVSTSEIKQKLLSAIKISNATTVITID